MATNDEYNSLKYINIETGNDLMDLKKKTQFCTSRVKNIKS